MRDDTSGRIAAPERANRHTLRALGAQREIVQKAFDQINLALLEQEMTLRAHVQYTEEHIREI